MHLKKIIVKNYKNYLDTTIELSEGLNIVVGSNNSGKSNLLSVIDMLYDDVGQPKFCSVENFNKNHLFKNYKSYLKSSPQIEIFYQIEHVMNYEKEDSAFSKLQPFIVYDGSGRLEPINANQELIFAEIVLRYELDSQKIDDYVKDMSQINNYVDFFEVIKKYQEDFKWSYYSTTTEGRKEKKLVNNIFEIELISATRVVSKLTDNSRRYIVNKFKENSISMPEIQSKLTSTLRDNCKIVTAQIDEEISKDQDNIGITAGKNSFVSNFEFEGDLSECFKYELHNEVGGYNLPLENNGLGYNNLIFIRNLIKEKKDNDYNILMIEEPEAHLHPCMQYKLLKYINSLKNQNIGEGNNIQNQIIITTHSSNITANAELDSIISLSYFEQGDNPNVIAVRLENVFDFNYVKKVLDIQKTENQDDTYFEEFTKKSKEILLKSKTHLEKFLDVTRSDILFSSKIILVEGIAEKLTLPKMYEQLIDKHVVVVELGGINFNYFLPLCINAHKKVLCITDSDFKYYEKVETNGQIIDKLQNILTIEKRTNNVDCLFNFYAKNSLMVATQQDWGNTFETELLIDNFDDDIAFDFLMKSVLPQSLEELIANKNFDYWKQHFIEIENGQTRKLIQKHVNACSEQYYMATTENKKVIEKIFFANIFYAYAKNAKGNLALTIADEFNAKIKIPNYISEGIKWLL